jgi:hypothetical protein
MLNACGWNCVETFEMSSCVGLRGLTHTVTLVVLGGRGSNKLFSLFLNRHYYFLLNVITFLLPETYNGWERVNVGAFISKYV